MRCIAAVVLAISSLAGTLPLTFIPAGPDQYSTRGAMLGRGGRVVTSSGVGMRFEGAREVAPLGRSATGAVANVAHGGDTRLWKTGLPVYSRVRYDDLYRGVDVVYYGAGSQLEFDFELAAGADVEQIRMVFDGAPGLRIGGSGELIAGNLRLLAPDIGHYVLLGGNRAGIRVPARDLTQPLRIDPRILWSTYLGGALMDQANAVAVDSTGNVYVAGQTMSNNFPIVNAAQPAYTNSTEVFIAKLTPGGDRLIYSTYLGGAGIDIALAIAVDGVGNAYVTGSTGSADFPLRTPLQSTFRGGSGITDAFLTKLNPNGGILFSTFLGGTGDDFGRGIALDGSGNIYIGGETAATDFPVIGNPFPVRGSRDGFIAKIAPAGDRILYATYLGGTGFDSVNAIAVDSAGTMYAGGQTRSSDFPATPGSFQPNHGSSLDGFVVKLTPAGDRAVYSTYFGTGGDEGINGIAIDSLGAAHVVGTADSGIPRSGGGVTPVTSGMDGFAVRFNASGSDYVYARLLSGALNESGTAVAVDGSGNAYYAGDTTSSNYFVSGAPPQPNFGGVQDGFVTKVDPLGAVVYSTYVGGSQADVPRAIAVDASGAAFVVGTTASANFPVTSGVVQSASGDGATGLGGGDSFITRIGDPPAAIVAVSVSPAAVSLGPGGTQQFTAQVTNATNTTVTWSIAPNAGTVSPGGLYTAPAVITAAVTVIVTATSAADPTKSASAIVQLTPPVTIAVTVTPSTASVAAGGTQQFTATVTGTSNTAVSWSIAPAGVGSITQQGLYRAPDTIGATTAVTVTASSVADASRSAMAIVTLTRPSGPLVTAAGVVNGASFLGGPISPGLIATIFGELMGPANLVTLRLGSDGRVAATLAGTRVLFDEAAGPMVYTSATQVAVIVPYSVAGKTTTQMVVEFQGVRSTPVTLQVAAASPAIFTADSSGKGQGAILNEDTTANSSDNAAAAGSIVVIFATGEGQTTPGGVDGQPATSVFPKPNAPLTVNIGGRNAEVLYFGAAPNLVAGVLQVNARIPAGTPPGAAAITINVGGVNSPAGVTVMVR